MSWLLCVCCVCVRAFPCNFFFVPIVFFLFAPFVSFINTTFSRTDNFIESIFYSSSSCTQWLNELSDGKRKKKNEKKAELSIGFNASNSAKCMMPMETKLAVDGKCAYNLQTHAPPFIENERYIRTHIHTHTHHIQTFSCIKCEYL